ncbi:hypothetical protein B0T09DRAFT_345961 [Sordaria sp. MPI-SDFR-AT-0083]|nr:hypothetical protein B0T09DRAFT_345961 [Sordaria sp. MPI-SDFR-AT-0083]
MPSDVLKDKNNEPIHEGDHIFARSRGERHEGEVEKIVATKEEAGREGAKHSPRCCLPISMVIMWNIILRLWSMGSIPLGSNGRFGFDMGMEGMRNMRRDNMLMAV